MGLSCGLCCLPCFRTNRLKTTGTARDQVRLIGQEGALASAWLTVTPSRAYNTSLSDTDFRSLCRFWLGLPLLPDGSTYLCLQCGEGVDPFGDLLVLCAKNGSTRRHNAVRDAWAFILSTAGISFIKEATSTSGRRPADILLLSWDLGRDTAVDFTVSQPLARDCYPLSLDRAKRHLTLAEDQKYSQERQTLAATTMRWGLLPAAFSLWGGMGTGAKHLLFEVTKRAKSDTPVQSKEFRNLEILQHLSMALARQLASQLSLRCRILEDLGDL